jgi:hypothetical protein
VSITERKPNTVEPITPSNQPLTTHPQWCSPLRCTDTDSDRQHCSDLIPEHFRDAQVTLAWVAADEYAFPTEPGSPELRIDIAHSMQNNDSTLYLNPAEVQRFIERLTTEYHRNVYLSAPVVRDSRAVA